MSGCQRTSKMLRFIGGLAVVLALVAPRALHAQEGLPNGFATSSDCARCHPRQFDEWRTSPHAYTSISPTFWSLMNAGQNSGAGAINADGVSVGGAVGNFCAPCHGPLAYVGDGGSIGGNNAGLANVRPIFPFVCTNRLLDPNDPEAVPCTTLTSVADCGRAAQCNQFEGRACANTPPVREGSSFPRRIQLCQSDAECGEFGPCIISPSTIFFAPRGQEGINCETCHNMLPNHRRACQLFRNSDSVGTFSYDLAARVLNGQRLRLGPYPLASSESGLGRPNDTLPLRANTFHASARVDTPLMVPYDVTDRPRGAVNPGADPSVVRPTELTCGELPYCGGGVCQGGWSIGDPCMTDVNCGGCGMAANGENRCSGTNDGQPCRTSADCGRPDGGNRTLLDRGIDEGTIGPLTGREVNGSHVLDRPDGNFFRSGVMCATCHDVRPPQVNMTLRSCQLQKTHVCATDADCRSLNIGCPGNDCGPCVAESNSILNTVGDFPPGDPQNTGYRRVENLFSEWQISVYNHPEMRFCQGDSFKACNADADCGANGPCNVQSPYGRVITCQDCHMSQFPNVPLIQADGTVTPENDLYKEDLVAVEGSQIDVTNTLPRRRVSTHFMAAVDLPLVAHPGQNIQRQRRQDIVDSAFKITLDETPRTAQAGQPFGAEVTIENVGVGHRVPAGFSHERQYWVQMYVQDAAALGDRDPFDPSAPCNLQHVIATGADDTRDPGGAAALAAAGCVYRSGFVLDKAHPETGEVAPDGSRFDEDPEDFFVVAGTRVRGLAPSAGNPGTPRIEVRPGAEGRALTIQNICAAATEEAYREGIADGTGIDLRANSDFPHRVRLCSARNSPNPGGPGVTASGFGNPACMENGEDLGPCVQEIELSDGNERGRCARNLTKALCESDADCGDDGPCLFRCERFPELECCDPASSAECREHLARIGVARPCMLEPGVCIGGADSGKACSRNTQCQSGNCGDVGPCKIEKRGIVNFQNAFRATTNGVCVDPDNPRDANRVPIPLLQNGQPVPCLLNLACTLRAVRSTDGARPGVCLVNGQCENAAQSPCTNYTVGEDCGGAACNTEANLELNGRASESVFIQNHPYNFNSLPPFQPHTFEYEFEVPDQFNGRNLVVAARIMSRHFPMRFLRNLVGSQVVRPPLVVEAQGDPANPDECRDQRRIDIDCYVRPLAILGNAEPGGFFPAEQRTRRVTVNVQ
jgi:hypothetical protein